MARAPCMTLEALTGSWGLGRQSAFGSIASTTTFLPVLNENTGPTQMSNTLQPEIGGDYFLRGSYKSGVHGGGNVSYYPRGDSIGNFLYALCGADSVTPVSGQTGAYQHVFTPFTPAAGADLPWYTLIKDVSKTWTQQHLNAKLASLSMDISRQQVVTSTADWFATTPSEITEIATPTYDSSPTFVACEASVAITNEVGGAAFSTTLDTSVDRLNINYRNNISTDEFVVGSFYPSGVTLLQRTCDVSLDILVRDKLLWEAVYQNSGTAAWSPTLVRAALTVTLTSTTNIAATTQPWSLTFTFPGLDLIVMPIDQRGAQLIRSTVNTHLTLGPSGSDRFTVTLISSQSAY